jgi:hypothetical protein
MTEWWEEAAPADLDDLLDRPVLACGLTRLERTVVKRIECCDDPVVAWLLDDDALDYTHQRDPNDPNIVLAKVLWRESGEEVVQLRIRWNEFFEGWWELTRADLLEAAVLDCLASQPLEMRAQIELLIPDGMVNLRYADDDNDCAILSIGSTDFGRVHRSRLLRRFDMA